MYTLTLTADERRAFDWVGSRHNSDKVADLLMYCMPEHQEWRDDGAISFDIPEGIAWQINDLAKEEDYWWACFALKLVGKLNDLCWGIV